MCNVLKDIPLTRYLIIHLIMRFVQYLVKGTWKVFGRKWQGAILSHYFNIYEKEWETNQTQFWGPDYRK
jgi:hypothetical protein